MGYLKKKSTYYTSKLPKPGKKVDLGTRIQNFLKEHGYSLESSVIKEFGRIPSNPMLRVTIMRRGLTPKVMDMSHKDSSVDGFTVLMAAIKGAHEIEKIDKSLAKYYTTNGYNPFQRRAGMDGWFIEFSKKRKDLRRFFGKSDWYKLMNIIYP